MNFLNPSPGQRTLARVPASKDLLCRCDQDAAAARRTSVLAALLSSKP